MTEKEKKAAAAQQAGDKAMLNDPNQRRATLGKAQGLRAEPNKMPDVNVPATPAPVEENWVQKLERSVHRHFVNLLKGNKTNGDPNSNR